MVRLNKRWQIAPRIPPDADLALKNYPPILRQLLYNRQCKTPEAAQRYLDAQKPEGTDPFNLLGIPEAVDRILWAIQKREQIAIYGDYDVDGVTATALLVQVLKALGADVAGYIPNRFEEGYGLNTDALDHLHEQGVQLVVTVDCGIRSMGEAQHASRLGMDLIITDHHQPGKDLPQAISLINPKQPGDNYPEKNLAGVGLAYKLASALTMRTQLKPNPVSEASILDLVALGTVADLAPLTGENRALVRAGLEYIRRPHRQGVMSLIGVSGLQRERITAADIGYILGPRLNAAGRLESALDALELLTCSTPETAGRLAQQLDNQNRERQKLTHETQIQAEQIALAENPDALLLFASHESFNPGVVGLAASRLTEIYYRPTVVAVKGEQFTRASCRSIPEFHITNALDECAELLEHHGGHAAAAGFTVKNEKLHLLVQQLQEIASRELAHLPDLRPKLTADVELPLSELKPEILQHLERLQPTGYGNPEAQFVSRDLKVVRCRAVGRDEAHLKLTVTDGRITYDAIAFNQGHWIHQMPSQVDLLYCYEVNEYNGRASLQLRVRDLKPAGTAD